MRTSTAPSAAAGTASSVRKGTRPPRPWRAIPIAPSAGPLGLGHTRAWLGLENARRVLQRLQWYAEACGPLARVRVGPLRILVVSDARLAGEVLSADEANYKGAAYILTRVVLDNVLLLNGEAWARHRKAYRAALKHVEPRAVAREVTRRFVDGLLASAGEPVQLDRATNRLVRDVVGGFVAGVTLPEELEPHRHRVQYELAAVGIDLQCQPWKYLSPRRWLELRRSVAALRAFFREAVRERLARRPGDDPPDILGGFLALARAGDYPLDVDALQEGIVNFFFSATDVLASTAGWTTWLLATHAAEQERLRAALAHGPADVDDNEPLGEVIKEALRLYPGYSLFGRTTQADLVIGGHHVPRGTMLLFSPFVTHRLERHWPDATRFVPARWAGHGLGAPPPVARDHYLPFGSGLRGCLAAHLATPLLKELVAGIVPRARLRAVEGHQPDVVYWGTTFSANGLPAYAEPV